MKNQLSLSNRKNNKLFIIVFFMICTCCGFISTLKAQDSGTSISFVKTQQAIDKNETLKKLLYDLQPTLFLSQESINSYGQGDMLIAECPINAIYRLYEANPAFESVKVIKIKVSSPEEAGFALNIYDLKSFDQLQYIQLIYEYKICTNDNEECIPVAAQKCIIGQSSNPLTILYQLSLPN